MREVDTNVRTKPLKWKEELPLENIDPLKRYVVGERAHAIFPRGMNTFIKEQYIYKF